MVSSIIQNLPMAHNSRRARDTIIPLTKEWYKAVVVMRNLNKMSKHLN